MDFNQGGARMLNVTAVEKDFLFSEDGIKYLKTYLSEQGLSRRETEVVVLVLQGLTNKQVADKLCVAEKTVKFHLTNIYKRMKISRRSQIVWTLPLGNFVEKFRERSTHETPEYKYNRTESNANASIEEESDVEISIPVGRTTVGSID